MLRLCQGDRHNDRLTLSRYSVTKFSKIDKLEDCQRFLTNRNHSINLWSNTVIAVLAYEIWRHVGKSVTRNFPLRIIVNTDVAQM
jgi:hypothetical protein